MTRCTHAYITQLYSMSLQSGNKAVEHLINSTPVLGRNETKQKTNKKEEEKKSRQCLSHKEQEGREGKGERVGVGLSQAVEGLSGVL